MSEALKIALMGPRQDLMPQLMSPQQQQYNRRAAASQFKDATSTAPVRHWTQAAARTLGGLGSSMRETYAAEDDQARAQAQKEALMQALNGGDLSASAQMLMGNPGTADMGAQLATTAISQRQAAANRAASEQAKLAAEQRAHERAKELVQMRLQAQGGGSASYGKSGAIVQGPGGRFFSVQFADDGTRKIMPLTFEEAQAQGVLGDGFAGIRGGEGAQQPAAAPVPLSPAKGVKTVDDGTSVRIISGATGDEIGQIQKSDTGPSKFNEVANSEGAKYLFGKPREDALAARSSLDNLATARQLLDSDAGMYAGQGADWIMQGARTLQLLGISGQNTDEMIANTEAYAANMGREVGNVIRAFGSGTGLSDADREYAQKIAAGQITLTPKALSKLIGIGEAVSRAKVEGYNKLLSGIESKRLPYPLEIDLPASRQQNTESNLPPGFSMKRLD